MQVRRTLAYWPALILCSAFLSGGCSGIDAVQEQDSEIAYDARAQVLQMLPEETAAAFVAENPSEFLSQFMSLTGQVEDPGFDPWVTVKTFFGMNNGVDDTGVLAAGVIAPSETCNGSAFILIPVDDWETFPGNWGLTTLDEAAVINLFYLEATVSRAGDHALLQIGPGDCIAGGLGNTWLAPATDHVARIIDADGAVLVVNPPAAEAYVLDSIAEARSFLTVDLAVETSTPDMTSYMQILELYLDAAERLVQDTKLGVMGLDFSGETVLWEMAAQFVPGSPTEQILSAPSGGATRLAELPAGPFLMATWTDMATLDFSALLDHAQSRLNGGDTYSALIFASLSTYLGVNHSASVMRASPDGEQPFTQVSVMGVEDAALFLDNMGESLSQTQIFFDSMAEQVGEVTPEMSIESVHVPNAFEIDGRRVDAFQFSMDSEILDEGYPGGGFMSALGLGFVSSMAVDDGNRVITVNHGDEEMLRSLLSFAGESLDNVDAIQTARAAGLPDTEAGEIFVDMSEVITLFDTMDDSAAPARPELPLVAGFIYTGDTELAARLAVPKSVISYAIDWFERFEEQSDFEVQPEH